MNEKRYIALITAMSIALMTTTHFTTIGYADPDFKNKYWVGDDGSFASSGCTKHETCKDFKDQFGENVNPDARENCRDISDDGKCEQIKP